MFSRLLGISLLSLLPLASWAFHGHNAVRNHQDIAKRTSGDVHLYSRFVNTKMTWYDSSVGLGACGQFNGQQTFTVALNVAQYGNGYPGPNCFKWIRITYGGKSVDAQIMDECEACPSNGGIDLTYATFDALAPRSVGVIYGEWDFIDGPGDTTTSIKPTPTTTWTPPPTSTHKTTSWTTTSTTSHTSESHSSNSSAWSSTWSSTSSTSVTPSPIPTVVPGPNTLTSLVQAFLQLGNVIVIGAEGN